jgi:hypothetical protein
MMTALSVARECKLIGSQERIILASLSPPSVDSEISSIEWREFESSGALTSDSASFDSMHFQVDELHHDR